MKSSASYPRKTPPSCWASAFAPALTLSGGEWQKVAIARAYMRDVQRWMAAAIAGSTRSSRKSCPGS